MIQRLRRFYNRMLADSEGQTDAEGFLSWRGETHALGVGTAVGALAVLSSTYWLLGGVLVWALVAEPRGLHLPYPSQLKKEAGYLLGGLLAGVSWGVTLRYLLEVV